MRRTLLAWAGLVVLAAIPAAALDIGPLAVGFHLTPALEAADGHRTWDLSLSFSATLQLTAGNTLEFLAMVDSKPSTLGTSLTYCHRITSVLTAGGGMTVLWPFSADDRLLKPIIGSFAHGAVRGAMATNVIGEASVSFPLITIVHRYDGWDVVPLAELPTLTVAAEYRLAESAGLQERITLQPVITDTTQLVHPVGRISDELLVLPMFSTFLRYLP